MTNCSKLSAVDHHSIIRIDLQGLMLKDKARTVKRLVSNVSRILQNLLAYYNMHSPMFLQKTYSGCIASHNARDVCTSFLLLWDSVPFIPKSIQTHSLTKHKTNDTYTSCVNSLCTTSLKTPPQCEVLRDRQLVGWNIKWNKTLSNKKNLISINLFSTNKFWKVFNENAFLVLTDIDMTM